MSQVKKFQNGSGKEGITPNVNTVQNKTYKIKVDGRDFDVDEDALDTHFDTAFKELVQKGYAKEGDRSQWFNKFKDFKNVLQSGADIDMTGENLGSLSLKGDLSKEQLGLTEEGTTAKSSRFGRFIKGGVKDDAQMNALLHGMLGQSIGQSAGLAKKEAEDKLKQDEETAKTKRKEEVQKILSRLDPSKRGFGVGYLGEQEGADKDFALKYFWGKGKTDVDRNYMYGKAMANFGKELFSDKYKDKDVVEAAKEKGIDIDSLKAAFTSRGFNPEDSDAFAKQYKTRGIKSFEDFHNALDILKTDAEYFDKDAYEALKAKATQSQTDGTAPANVQEVEDVKGANVDTDLPQQETTGQKTGWRMTDGVLTKDGKPFSGFRYHAPFSSSNAWYVHGKPVSQKMATEFVTKNPSEAAGFSSGYQESLAKHADFISKYGFTKLEKEDGKYRPDTFAFSDLIKHAGDSYAKDASADFTGVDRNNANLFEYVVFKGPKDNPTPVRKYRYYDKNTRTYSDGKLTKDPLTGNFIFRSDSGKYNINIGTANPSIDENVTNTRGNLYFGGYKGNDSAVAQSTSPSMTRAYKRANETASNMKNGGVFKHQSGGDLQRALAKVQGAQKQRTTATTSDVMHMNLSDADKWKLGGLAADLGGLVASFTGAGSVAGAGLGLGGSAASFVGDIKQGRDTGESLKDLGVNVGLDVLSAVPVLGLSAKAPKIAKALKASKTMLNAYFITRGLKGAAMSLRKIDDPENMTIDDWRNIAGGVQAVLSGKRTVDSAVATTKVKSNTIRANGKTIEITPEQAAKIKETKGKEAKMTEAKNAVAEKLGVKPEEVNIESTTSGIKLNKTINPLKLISSGKKPDVTVTSANKLKDIDQYSGSGITNWYMRSAIRNTAYLNPMLAGSDKLLAPRFKQNEKGEYVQVFEGSSGGPGWLGSRRNTYISKEGEVDKATADVANRNLKSDKFGLPEKGFVKETSESADVEPKAKTEETLPYSKTWREDLANEMANRRESRSKASERLNKYADITSTKLGEQIGNERLTRSSARLSSSPVAQRAEREKSAKESSSREAARRNVESRLLKERKIAERNIIEKENRDREARKKIREQSLSSSTMNKPLKKGRVFVTNSRGENISLSDNQLNTLSKIKPENRKSFIDNNFRDGGVLKAHEGGAVSLLKKIKKKIIETPGTVAKKVGETASNVANKVETPVSKTSSSFSIAPLKKIELSKPKIEKDLSAFKQQYNLSGLMKKVSIDYMPEQTKLNAEFAEKNKARNLSNIDKLKSAGIMPKMKLPSINIDGNNNDNEDNESGFDTPEEKGNKENALSKLSKYVDPVDLSELGRAAFISQHNKGVNTNVQAPIYQHGLELPTSVRGNLLLKSIFNKQAQDVLRRGQSTMSADPTLNRLANLALLRQAGDIEQEGATRDAEAIDRSLARQEEVEQTYADRRSEIANKNIQSLAAKAESERQLENLKRDAVAQPYEDLWMQKNLEMKQKQAMLKDYKVKAGLEKLQGKYATEIATNQEVIDKYAGRKDLNPQEKSEFDKAYANMRAIQEKINNEAMRVYANPNDIELDENRYVRPNVSSSGFRYIPVRREGGKAKDRMLEEYKERMKTTREREKLFNRIITDKYRETSREMSKAKDRINEIIKMSLK